MKDLSPVFVNKNGSLCEIIAEDSEPFTRFLTGVDRICHIYMDDFDEGIVLI